VRCSLGRRAGVARDCAGLSHHYRRAALSRMIRP
jgi:hypothetical protein